MKWGRSRAGMPLFSGTKCPPTSLKQPPDILARQTETLLLLRSATSRLQMCLQLTGSWPHIG